MANLESPMNLTCCGELLEEAEVPGKKTLRGTGRTCKCHKRKTPIGVSNQEPHWCEATVLTAAPVSDQL